MECLSREIREELSDSKLQDMEYYGIFKEKDKKSLEGLETRVYFAKINEKYPKPSKEISECEWVSLPTNYNLSNVTSKILNSLLKKDYLNLRFG